MDIDQKKMKIARHEVGHAVMALIHHQRVNKISIKEMDSPKGTDKYLGFTMLESDERDKFTINMADSKVMISLGGYASEILFYESAGIGGDDLITAINLVEDMLQVESFKKLVTLLPLPNPNDLQPIKNSLVRSYIDYKFRQTIEALSSFKPIIHIISEELYNKDELNRSDVSFLFNSFINPI